MQFFGKTFYSPSLEDYKESDLFEGSSPAIIFLNFIINYTTGVSISVVFALTGIIYLFLKDKKDPSDIFLIFIVISFVNILIDKRYVRLFIIPIISIVAAYGIISIHKKISMPENRKKFGALFLALVILALVIAGYTSQYRQIFFEKRSVFPFKEQYWQTGQYLSKIQCNCSIITTEEQVAGVTIFASSGVPGGSNNIYYYVDKSHIKTEQLNLSSIIDSFKRGNKVTSFWKLPDWIFGGEYYLGRHTRNLFKMDYREKIAQQIIEDYNVKYYIHDNTLDANRFYSSIIPAYNKVYSNPMVEMYNLDNGRIIKG
jgi:hypothetical protein